MKIDELRGGMFAVTRAGNSLEKMILEKENVSGENDKTSLFLIRNVKESDINELLEIEQDCFCNSRLQKYQFKYLLRHGKCDFIICEENQKVAGYAISLYRKNSTEARIYSIAIHSRYRKKGYGVLILNEISQRAIQHGCRSIRLEMDISNEVARKFYEKIGFMKNGIIDHYYGNNLKALKLRKIL